MPSVPLSMAADTVPLRIQALYSATNSGFVGGRSPICSPGRSMAAASFFCMSSKAVCMSPRLALMRSTFSSVTTSALAFSLSSFSFLKSSKAFVRLARTVFGSDASARMLAPRIARGRTMADAPARAAAAEMCFMVVGYP